MLLTPVGEDSIALCKECDYRANIEMTETIIENNTENNMQELILVHTPNIKTIDDLCTLMNIDEQRCCKAVVFQRVSNGKYIVLFIRGDLDVNETKLRNYLGDEIQPAVITEDSLLIAGSIGPYNLSEEHVVLFDRSLEGLANLSCGANIPDHHYMGLNISRDIGEVEYHDFL